MQYSHPLLIDDAHMAVLFAPIHAVRTRRSFFTYKSFGPSVVLCFTRLGDDDTDLSAILWAVEYRWTIVYSHLVPL